MLVVKGRLGFKKEGTPVRSFFVFNYRRFIVQKTYNANEGWVKANKVRLY